MKTKIIILNVEHHLYKTMLENELKELAEKYEVIFAYSIMDALDKIAIAKLKEKNPIYGLVFQRDTLVPDKRKCKFVSEFADHYTQSLTVINMINNAWDRDYAVSVHCCPSGNWEQVKNIFDNHIKE